MKKCKWADKANHTCTRENCLHPSWVAGKDGYCSPSPKKPKVAKFKAWARYSPVYNGWTAIEDTSDMSPWDRIPCTIVIDKKHLKGAK